MRKATAASIALTGASVGAAAVMALAPGGGEPAPVAAPPATVTMTSAAPTTAAPSTAPRTTSTSAPMPPEIASSGVPAYVVPAAFGDLANALSSFTADAAGYLKPVKSLMAFPRFTWENGPAALCDGRGLEGVGTYCATTDLTMYDLTTAQKVVNITKRPAPTVAIIVGTILGGAAGQSSCFGGAFAAWVGQEKGLFTTTDVRAAVGAIMAPDPVPDAFNYGVAASANPAACATYGGAK